MSVRQTSLFKLHIPINCVRWGYTSVNDTMDQVKAMRAADIPLEGKHPAPTILDHIPEYYTLVMWNDIDLYHAFRDFTTDPVSFPADEERAFIQELVSERFHCEVVMISPICTTDI